MARIRQETQIYKIAYQHEKVARLLSEKILQTKIQELHQANKTLAKLLSERQHSEAVAKKNYINLQDALGKLEKVAHYDAVTKLPNRSYFESTLKAEIQKAELKYRFALMYVDLDYFKSINDRFGHAAGDLLLESVGARLRNNVRVNDFVARIGGDEFAIILKHIHKIEHAKTIAEEILSEINVPHKIGKKIVSISASIGISYYPESGTNTMTLCENADIAMYKAKERGRNNYQYFKKSFQFEQKRYFEVENALNFAIKKNEFFLVYQPAYYIHTKKIASIEVFLRWKHPPLGLISSDEFIPIAEKDGTIFSIGEWVLKKACEQYMQWKKEKNIHYTLMINLSIQQLKEEKFAQSITNILNETNMPPECLELEISEKILISNLDKIQKTLKKIQKLGVKIGISNFGVGYSSLSQLKKLNANGLKIDTSFFKNMHFRNKNHINLIIQSIIVLARGLNLDVIADGVETKAQEFFLKVNDCEKAQGYYYQEPMSANELKKLI